MGRTLCAALPGPWVARHIGPGDFFITRSETPCVVRFDAPEKSLPVNVFGFILPRRNFAGSCIGGIPEAGMKARCLYRHSAEASSTAGRWTRPVFLRGGIRPR